MKNKKGQFVKGYRSSRETEFKKGQHWRKRKPYWDKGWLYNEYITKQRSSSEIASDFDVTEAAIIFFLRKHNIDRRNVSEARAVKHWGNNGESNPMFGRTGSDNPNWKGGATPDRQAFYASKEWKRVVREVWKRDNGQCQRCQRKPRRSNFHIHHITSFSTVELRMDPDNLILLCQECHWWVHSKKNINGEFIR